MHRCSSLTLSHVAPRNQPPSPQLLFSQRVCPRGPVQDAIAPNAAASSRDKIQSDGSWPSGCNATQRWSLSVSMGPWVDQRLATPSIQTPESRNWDFIHVIVPFSASFAASHSPRPLSNAQLFRPPDVSRRRMAESVSKCATLISPPRGTSHAADARGLLSCTCSGLSHRGRRYPLASWLQKDPFHSAGFCLADAVDTNSRSKYHRHGGVSYRVLFF